MCSSNTSENTFFHELKKFFHVKWHLISKLEEPCEKETRRQPFNIDEAKSASEAYIRMVWKAMADKTTYTDLSESSCSYTEAPAEGIFSIYDMILT